MWVAKKMTFPEVVCDANMTRLQTCIRRGTDEHPGASFIHKKNGVVKKLQFALKAARTYDAEKLEVTSYRDAREH